MNKYEVLGVVGEGAYGVVLRCRNKEKGEVVAIKKFKEGDEDDVVRKTTMREVKVLRMLKHPNIVSLKEAFRRKGKLYLVFEYVEMNLLEVLEDNPQGLQPALVEKYMFQLCCAIDWCHSHGIMHRDIKPENLLVNRKTDELKICDFGFARPLAASKQQDLTDYVATRWYRAPELLLGSTRYSPAVDLWAIGCIMGELVDGQPLFPGESEIDQLYVVQKALGPLTAEHSQLFFKNPRFAGLKFPDMSSPETLQKRFLGRLSKRAMALMSSMLLMEPRDRLTSREAVEHALFEPLAEEFLRQYPHICRPQSGTEANPTSAGNGGGGGGGSSRPDGHGEPSSAAAAQPHAIRSSRGGGGRIGSSNAAASQREEVSSNHNGRRHSRDVRDASNASNAAASGGNNNASRYSNASSEAGMAAAAAASTASAAGSGAGRRDGGGGGGSGEGRRGSQASNGGGGSRWNGAAAGRESNGGGDGGNNWEGRFGPNSGRNSGVGAGASGGGGGGDSRGRDGRSGLLPAAPSGPAGVAGTAAPRIGRTIRQSFGAHGGGGNAAHGGGSRDEPQGSGSRRGSVETENNCGGPSSKRGAMGARGSNAGVAASSAAADKAWRQQQQHHHHNQQHHQQPERQQQRGGGGNYGMASNGRGAESKEGPRWDSREGKGRGGNGSGGGNHNNMGADQGHFPSFGRAPRDRSDSPADGEGPLGSGRRASRSNGGVAGGGGGGGAQGNHGGSGGDRRRPYQEPAAARAESKGEGRGHGANVHQHGDVSSPGGAEAKATAESQRRRAQERDESLKERELQMERERQREAEMRAFREFSGGLPQKFVPPHHLHGLDALSRSRGGAGDVGGGRDAAAASDGGGGSSGGGGNGADNVSGSRMGIPLSLPTRQCLEPTMGNATEQTPGRRPPLGERDPDGSNLLSARHAPLEHLEHAPQVDPSVVENMARLPEPELKPSTPFKGAVPLGSGPTGGGGGGGGGGGTSSRHLPARQRGDVGPDAEVAEEKGRYLPHLQPHGLSPAHGRALAGSGGGGGGGAGSLRLRAGVGLGGGGGVFGESKGGLGEALGAK